MQLRNKKTGEIGYLIASRDNGPYVVTNNEWVNRGEYDSLAELNEEWEDASEEPKEYWCVDYDGGILSFSVQKETATDKLMKSIGNYFSSREEAELAVRKLKAWKRLKDKGFRFYGWNKGSLLIEQPNNIVFACDDTRIWAWENIQDDLDLLFGGEE